MQSSAIFVLSAVCSALIGLGITGLVTYYKLRWRWRHVRDLLNFGEGDVLFVIPHRELEANSIMPRVAAEDVLAMMNVVQLITRAGLHVHFKVKDTKNLSEEDRKKNIITIGGAKVNDYTDWILNKVTAASVHFERDPDNKFILKRRRDTTYVSPSHELPDGAPVEAAREDIAFLFKFRNPRNDAAGTIVVGLAGLRGIGTWAAADCLRKKYRELHRRKQADGRLSKAGEFIAFFRPSTSDSTSPERELSILKTSAEAAFASRVPSFRVLPPRVGDRALIVQQAQLHGKRAATMISIRPPNVLSVSCAAGARVPKSLRRDGRNVRAAAAAGKDVGRRAAGHTWLFTRRLGRRAEVGPRQLH